jgi:hypothetical protein
VERIPSSSSNLLVVAGAKRLRTVSECNWSEHAGLKL